jgi:hypothetical protein
MRIGSGLQCVARQHPNRCCTSRSILASRRAGHGAFLAAAVPVLPVAYICAAQLGTPSRVAFRAHQIRQYRYSQPRQQPHTELRIGSASDLRFGSAMRSLPPVYPRTRQDH